VSPLADRIAELRAQLEHLRLLQTRVVTAGQLKQDISLRNDVLFSQMMAAQLLSDISAQLSSEMNAPFGDYTEAVRNLGRLAWIPEDLVGTLERLPGFRSIVIHEYVGLDYDLVLAALRQLEPLEEFVRLVAAHLLEEA
jgi:uncharacterized protein YutE (UPF0331/DUF86 family)